KVRQSRGKCVVVHAPGLRLRIGPLVSEQKLRRDKGGPQRQKDGIVERRTPLLSSPRKSGIFFHINLAQRAAESLWQKCGQNPARRFLLGNAIARLGDENSGTSLCIARSGSQRQFRRIQVFLCVHGREEQRLGRIVEALASR